MTAISGLGGVDYGALVRQATEARKATGPGAEFKLPESQAAAPERSAGMESLDQGLRSLSESHENADKMVMDLASGRDINIHNTMVALEQADIALKFTVQLRNRALSAYEELMRIQV